MIPRALIVVCLFVVAVAHYDDAEAEDTRPITTSQFNRRYVEYLAKIKECGDQQECVEEENNKFRTVTQRGVQSEVIGQIKCKKGKFGRFEIVVDGKPLEVDLPC